MLVLGIIGHVAGRSIGHGAEHVAVGLANRQWQSDHSWQAGLAFGRRGNSYPSPRAQQAEQ